MIRSSLVAISLALATVPAHAGSILDAAKPANALLVEFSSPDTSPTDRLKAGHLLTVGVVVSRSTGAMEIAPASTPQWMTYDSKHGSFRGFP